ncbi:MAG: hypothetical protein GY754_15910 [bacterium]|nr:hypothetical protein [bacterium]
MQKSSKKTLSVMVPAIIIAVIIIALFNRTGKKNEPDKISQQETTLIEETVTKGAGTTIFDRVFGSQTGSVSEQEPGNPGSVDDLNERIHKRNLTTIDIDNVREQAAVIERPYTNEKEKKEVQDKLGAEKVRFTAMIGETERNIKAARDDGSRTEEEISEAMEALAEMKKGRAFLSNRIEMVENDDFE